MWGWISRVANWATGGLAGDVVSAVQAAIHAILGWYDGLFHLLSDAWNLFWYRVGIFFHGAWHFIDAVWNKFFWILRHIVPWLQNWIEWLHQVLLKAINWVFNTLHALIEWVYHWADKFIRWLWHWVITEVWNPLKAWVDRIFKWIADVGETMWHYFTHLEDFADLLFWHLIHRLERYAWDAASYLGKFFLALFYHNAIRFAHLMEDIFDAIL